MLAAVAPTAGASRRPTVGFSVPSVSGDTARFTYSVDHGRQVIARLSCKLGPMPTPCGTLQADSPLGSSTYRVVLRGLAVGTHSYFVRVKFVNHEGELNVVRFSVAQCDAQNRQTGKQSYGTGSNLQTAIDVASNGDTVDVWGNCVGNFTIGNTSATVVLILVGHATRAVPEATLNGNHSGTVLNVVSTDYAPGTMITIRDLSTINGVDSGITVNPYATVTLNGTSEVDDNDGSGITTYSGGIAILDGTSQVDDNNGSGIFNSDIGSKVILNDASQVDGNHNPTGNGGGIDNNGANTLTLNGSSQVDDNTASDGAGEASPFSAVITEPVFPSSKN